MSPDPERWPSLSEGLGPVQLSWSGVLSGERRYAKAARVAAWVRDMRAAGHRVVEIDAVKSGGRAVTWWALDERPMRSGKSGPMAALAHPAFVEARRAATEDPTSTFARPRFRPV